MAKMELPNYMTLWNEQKIENQKLHAEIDRLRNTQRTQLAGMIAAGNPCRDATYLGAWAAETVQQADALLAELTKEEK